MHGSRQSHAGSPLLSHLFAGSFRAIPTGYRRVAALHRLGRDTASVEQWACEPGVSKAQIQTLAGLDFLRHTDNVLLTGKLGTGKTGLGIGLLREACLECVGRRPQTTILLPAHQRPVPCCPWGQR